MNTATRFALLFAAGLLILAISQCARAEIPSALHSGRIEFTAQGYPGFVPFTSNRAWGEDPDSVDVGILFQHGSGTDVGMGVNGLATTVTVGWDSRVFACAPQYLEEDGINAFKGGRNLATCAFWTPHGWGIGLLSDSTADNPRLYSITAFAIQDSILMRMAAEFPNLKKIVVCGHSAGAMMAQKTAMYDWVDSTLAADYDIDLVRIVLEAGTWVYLDSLRVDTPSVDRFVFPDTTGIGDSFDHMPRYGIADAMTFLGRTRTAVQDHYETQHILYVVGSADTVAITDQEDESLLQGTWQWRHGRTIIFWNHLRQAFGAYPPNQALHIIQGAEHDNAPMLADPVVRYWLFDYLMETGPVVDDYYSSALDFENLTQFQELTGFDSTRVRALWVPRADSLQAFSRTASLLDDIDPGVVSGSYDPRGGPFGDDIFACQISPTTGNYFNLPTTTGKDSTELENGTLLVLIYQTGDAVADYIPYYTGNTTWPGFLDNGKWRPRINGLYPITYGNTGQFSDNRPHIFWAAFFPDSLLVGVDNLLPTAAAAAAVYDDGTYPTIIGARSGGTYICDGRLALLMLYQLKATHPYEVQYFQLWGRINSYLTGLGPFAEIQPALDYLRSDHDTDGVVDTVHVRPGTYIQPFRIQVDSVFVDGDDPASVVIDGTGWTAGPCAGFTSGNSTVRNLTLRNSPDAGAAPYGNFPGARLENCLIYDNATGIYPIILGGANTFVIDNCTLISNSSYGLRVPASNQGIVYLIDSIIDSSGTVGALREGGTLIATNDLFFANTDDTTGTTVNTALITGQDPLFHDAPTRDYRLDEESPAAQPGVAYSGDWLGAFGLFVTSPPPAPGGPATRLAGPRRGDPWGGVPPFGTDPWSTGPWGR